MIFVNLCVNAHIVDLNPWPFQSASEQEDVEKITKHHY